jgi:hypothetical protein
MLSDLNLTREGKKNNPLATKLCAHCTMQKTQDLNGRPLFACFWLMTLHDIEFSQNNDVHSHFSAPTG